MTGFIIFLLLLFPLALVVRGLTVVMHELGHAIPIVLFTGGKVEIFIGSFGDKKKGYKWSIGLFEMWFHPNPLNWQRGLCIPMHKNISINKQIIYTLLGPVTSFVICMVSCYAAFTLDLHGFVKLIAILAFGSSTMDLYFNLSPRQNHIKLDDGELIHNDGYSIVQLFKLKKLPKEYQAAVDYYNQRNFEQAASLFEKILSQCSKNEYIYSLTISSLMQTGDYAKAKKYSDELIGLNKMGSDDFVNAGVAYLKLNYRKEASEFYDKSLELNPKNIYGLNNKGDLLILLEKYEKAILQLDKAIKIDNTFAIAFANRALAKIKLGQFAEGLEDINRCLELDKNNSYAHRNMGIYYMEKKDFNEALLSFKKAKELNSSTDDIDKLILSAEQRITNVLQ